MGLKELVKSKRMSVEDRVKFIQAMGDFVMNEQASTNIGGAITKGVVTFAVGLLIVSSVWGALSLESGDAFYNVSTTLETHAGTAFTIGIVGIIVMGAGWIMRQLDWF